MGNRDRFDAGLFPPGGLVAGAMDLAMVSATERNHELIADLAAKRARLGKAQMMRIGWDAGADETRLRRDISEMGLALLR